MGRPGWCQGSVWLGWAVNTLCNLTAPISASRIGQRWQYLPHRAGQRGDRGSCGQAPCNSHMHPPTNDLLSPLHLGKVLWRGHGIQAPWPLWDPGSVSCSCSFQRELKSKVLSFLTLWDLTSTVQTRRHLGRK